MRLALLTLFFFPFPAQSADWCQAPIWRLNRQESLKNLQEDFAKLDRFLLVQLAWGELTHSQSKPMYAPILHYLANTETTNELRAYYQRISPISLDENKFSELASSWPERAPHRGGGIALPELCDEYKKSGGTVPAEQFVRKEKRGD